MKQITRKISEMSLKAAARGVNTAAKAGSGKACEPTESDYESNQKDPRFTLGGSHLSLK